MLIRGFDCLNLNRFKLKYHPDESAQRKEEQLRNLKVRFLYKDFKSSIDSVFLGNYV